MRKTVKEAIDKIISEQIYNQVQYDSLYEKIVKIVIMSYRKGWFNGTTVGFDAGIQNNRIDIKKIEDDLEDFMVKEQADIENI